MKRCKNCKRWERSDTKGFENWGECLLAGSYNAEPVYPDSLAVANDFEGYAASLSTEERFGCVQWERKEVSK